MIKFVHFDLAVIRRKWGDFLMGQSQVFSTDVRPIANNITGSLSLSRSHSAHLLPNTCRVP